MTAVISLVCETTRTREASFQWYRALTLDPNDAERAALDAKLAGQAPSGAGSSQP